MAAAAATDAERFSQKYWAAAVDDAPTTRARVALAREALAYLPGSLKLWLVLLRGLLKLVRGAAPPRRRRRGVRARGGDRRPARARSRRPVGRRAHGGARVPSTRTPAADLLPAPSRRPPARPRRPRASPFPSPRARASP